MIAELQRQFSAIAGQPGRVFFAPGRINLIGEHTDYSGGYVLPASIGLGTWAVISPRTDDRIHVRSEVQNESIEFSVNALNPSAEFHWSDYVKAVAWALQRHGCTVGGADLLISGNVPLGSGLSSSASLEVAVAMAFLGNSEERLPPMQLARICQSAESDFVGARCGLMDQFIATHGMRDHALLLNCGTLEWQPIPLPVGYRWVVANTMVRHSLASGEYNVRRAEAEELQGHLQQWFPQYRYLHQLSDEEMQRLSVRLSVKLAHRLRHIVGENRRVSSFVDCLQTRNMGGAGALLAASHRSLRDDFEVSCRELDVMVELASQLPGVLGARMLGGGFGGCALALIEEAHVDDSVARLRVAYQQSTGIESWIYVCDIEQGARRVTST